MPASTRPRMRSGLAVAAPGGYPPPAVDPTVIGPTNEDAPASAAASASANASANASRSATPTRTPTGHPPAGGPAPLPYQLASGQLCPAMDFTTIAQNA